jgi:endonuclease I
MELLRQALTELAAAKEKEYLGDDADREAAAAYYGELENRNPLIDHPEWASEIAFAEGL